VVLTIDGASRELIAGYRRHMVRQALMRTTIDARASRLVLFAGWLGRDLSTATRDEVERFLDGRRIAAKARSGWVSHLHMLYTWALDEGLTQADPTVGVVRPRLRQGLPRPAVDDELDVALRLADRRMRAMLTCAALAGLRAKEIALLDRPDVLDSYSPPMLIAHGKGGKDRTLPMHPDLVDALRALPMPASGRVFRNGRGQAMSPTNVSHAVNTYLHGLGITSTLHQLRHWFATRYYAETRDLLGLKDLLGHASVETVSIYAKWVLDPAAVTAVRSLRIRPARPDPVVLERPAAG